MSATLPAAPPAQGMTRAELLELVKATAAEAIAPAVEKALGPLAKAQGDVLGRLIAKGSEGELEPDLGKFPIGRKIRALGLVRLATGRQVTGTPDDLDCAKAEVKKHWRLAEAESTQKWLDYAKKTTLQAGVAQTAGEMILPDFDPTWIELLRNNAVVRSIARTLPMPRGATTRRKQTDTATASYQGENAKITPSNLKVGRETLSYKKLTALSVISNDLIRFTGGEADRIVQEDLIRVSALREDRAFLVGNPPVDAGSPKGIRFYTKGDNVFASAGTSLANFQADLTKAVRLVEEANIAMNSEDCAWIMSPATFWAIFALVTTTGDWVFAQGLSQNPPRLLGYKVLRTTQLKISNSWVGANAGMIMFVHAPSLEIHDSLQRALTVWPGGAYHDPDANAVLSGISQDETVVTSIAEHDFFQVYDVAAAIITGYNT